MASSAWGAKTYVYLECNKIMEPMVGLKVIPTWLEISTVLKNGEANHRQVKTYKESSVEKGQDILRVGSNDSHFWWEGYSLDRETLLLVTTPFYSASQEQQCIIYPREEWKDRKNAYLDGLKKRRKL